MERCGGVIEGCDASAASVVGAVGIEAMNGASLDGRNLTVNIARPKEERPSGGGGGGGGRGPRRDFGGGGGGGGGRRERY